MKKVLLFVLSLSLMFALCACEQTTRVVSSSKIHTPIDQPSAQNNLLVNLVVDTHNQTTEIIPNDMLECFETSDTKTDENEVEICVTSVVETKETKHYCFIDGEYQDSNFDRLCDICGSDLAHYCNDTNNDNKCDTCFACFGITHKDTTGDGYCDIHTKCKTYLLEHNHRDKNTDNQCDLCYLPF